MFCGLPHSYDHKLQLICTIELVRKFMCKIKLPDSGYSDTFHSTIQWKSEKQTDHTVAVHL